MAGSNYGFHAVSEQSLAPDELSKIKSSISIQGGMINGLNNQFVYESGILARELNWQLQPVYLLGVVMNTQVFKMFYFNVGYWTGVNQDLGIVDRYEYSTDGSADYYSKNNNNLQKAHFVDANAGYIQRFSDRFSLTGMFGFYYMNIKMDSRNGYYEAPPGTTDLTFYGTGLAIEETFSIPYLGIGTTFKFNKFFYMQIVAIYSFLVSCEIVDSNYRDRYGLYGTINSGNYISLIAKLGWKISPYASLVAGFEYYNISPEKGESFSINLRNGDRTPVAPDTVNVSLDAIEVTISFEHSMKWF
jgi:outer membrane protease